jgi:hypothetical protein
MSNDGEKRSSQRNGEEGRADPPNEVKSFTETRQFLSLGSKKTIPLK